MLHFCKKEHPSYLLKILNWLVEELLVLQGIFPASETHTRTGIPNTSMFGKRFNPLKDSKTSVVSFTFNYS